MNNKLKLKKEEVWVQIDWDSTGVWVRSDLGNYLANTGYDAFNLPDDLIKRFEYWEEWYSSRPWPKMIDNEYKEYEIPDQLLFDTYGRSLAIDLKKFLGDTYRVYFGNYENPIEILLMKRDNGTIVPISNSVHPNQ